MRPLQVQAPLSPEAWAAHTPKLSRLLADGWGETLVMICNGAAGLVRDELSKRDLVVAFGEASSVLDVH